MIGRADVERAIVEDEQLVEQIARLLEDRAELDAWSDDLRVALALALEDAAMSRTEGWKAVTLRRHLFGPGDVVPARISDMSRQPALTDRARAERLRAALPARVKYRAGMYLPRDAR
jgi:hypothetical protein